MDISEIAKAFQIGTRAIHDVVLSEPQALDMARELESYSRLMAGLEDRLSLFDQPAEFDRLLNARGTGERA
jgi:hypothetical protein